MAPAAQIHFYLGELCDELARRHRCQTDRFHAGPLPSITSVTGTVPGVALLLVPHEMPVTKSLSLSHVAGHGPGSVRGSAHVWSLGQPGHDGEAMQHGTATARPPFRRRPINKFTHVTVSRSRTGTLRVKISVRTPRKPLSLSVPERSHRTPSLDAGPRGSWSEGLRGGCLRRWRGVRGGVR